MKEPQGPWNAETIRRARKARGLTQSELAEQLGCRQQTISEWELGMYGPKNAYQRLIGLFFGSAPNPESKVSAGEVSSAESAAFSTE